MNDRIIPMPIPEPIDTLQIRRVANGWIVSPGQLADREFVHVYSTPAELAAHVEHWASAQIENLQSHKVR
jgi:hypothetical protein